MLKLTMETPERRHWHCSGVFIVDFEHVSAGWVVSLNPSMRNVQKYSIYCKIFKVCVNILDIMY